jgi:serine/threonine protein kinase
VEAGVRDVLLLIREAEIGKSKYAFDADGNECGVPLIDYVRGHPKPYTEDRCRLLFSRVFMAVAALHDLNVVHRAIKQENIFVQVRILE